MADIGDALTQYLRSIESVSDLVGDRIRPDALSQNEIMPAIVYNLIDDFSEEHLGGIAGLTHTRVQIDCYGDTAKDASRLQESVRLAPLQGFRGLMHDVFVQGVSRAGSFRTETDDPKDGSDRWRYLMSADYIISHEEATS